MLRAPTASDVPPPPASIGSLDPCAASVEVVVVVALAGLCKGGRDCGLVV